MRGLVEPVGLHRVVAADRRAVDPHRVERAVHRQDRVHRRLDRAGHVAGHVDHRPQVLAGSAVGSRVVESTVTNRASGCGPRGGATGSASSASTDERPPSGSRGTIATAFARRRATLASPAGAPD